MTDPTLPNKCRALIAINGEIAQRCVALPRLAGFAQFKASTYQLEARMYQLEWRWRDLPGRVRKARNVLHPLGPMQMRLEDVAAVFDLVLAMEASKRAELLSQLLRLLEAEQEQLGRLEQKKEEALAQLRCIAQDKTKLYPLPWQFKHSLVVEFYTGSLQFKKGWPLARILGTPDTAVEKTVSQRSLACSWLALTLLGLKKLGVCCHLNSELKSGIYMRHDGREFHGFILQRGAEPNVRLFSFEEVATFVFGNLRVEPKTVAELTTMGDITDDAELWAQTLYYPI